MDTSRKFRERDAYKIYVLALSHLNSFAPAPDVCSCNLLVLDQLNEKRKVLVGKG